MTASMGKLAARTAHDVNNILHVIEAYAALIIRHPAEPNKVVEHAEVIRASVEEVAALVRQLLAAGREAEPKLDLADVNALIQRTAHLLTPMFSPTTVIAAIWIRACRRS